MNTVTRVILPLGCLLAMLVAGADLSVPSAFAQQNALGLPNSSVSRECPNLPGIRMQQIRERCLCETNSPLCKPDVRQQIEEEREAENQMILIAIGILICVMLLVWIYYRRAKARNRPEWYDREGRKRPTLKY